MNPEAALSWPFFRFGLLVTGRGEHEFLPQLFRSLAESGQCTFEVIRKIEQRSPITSGKQKAKMVASGKTIPNRDEEQIGLPARRFLAANSKSFVLLIDDLEGSRALGMTEIYAQYRLALDTMLGPIKDRASVHFLVNMLEAYYFAQPDAINDVLGTLLEDPVNDVETIPHPKNELKKISPGFDERQHGQQIIRRLDVKYILSRANACGSLRTMFAWCWNAMNLQPSDEPYQLLSGSYNSITRVQIQFLPKLQQPPALS